jgi:hypothetical protein
MKKVLSSLLVVSMLSITVPTFAAERDSTKQPVSPLRSAIAQSGSQLALTPAAPEAVKAQSVPRTMPRSGSDRIRQQGGGHVGMVIGLVSTLAGAAGTYYMIKAMKKSTDQAQKTQ